MLSIGQEQEIRGIDQVLYMICFHGAPTIHRLKPASLICFKNSQSLQLKNLWDQYSDEIKEMIPFNYREMKRCEDGVNVLFYWKDWIDRIVKRKKHAEYLKRMGYEDMNDGNDALNTLRNHFQCGCPDEIGIFLGYPLSDVIAFSSDEKRECLVVGYWKVYSNIPRAKKMFSRYDRARKHMMTSLENGAMPQNILQAYT